MEEINAINQVKKENEIAKPSPTRSQQRKIISTTSTSHVKSTSQRTKSSRKKKVVEDEEDYDFIVDDEEIDELEMDNQTFANEGDEVRETEGDLEEEIEKPSKRKRAKSTTGKTNTSSVKKTTTKTKSTSSRSPSSKRSTSATSATSTLLEPQKVTARKVTGGYRPKWLGPERDPPKHGSKPIPIGKPDCLKGIIFVLTGLNESLTREEMSELIKLYGG